jgi:glycosyltransferase involved in cell wall biosynthesis
VLNAYRVVLNIFGNVSTRIEFISIYGFFLIREYMQLTICSLFIVRQRQLNSMSIKSHIIQISLDEDVFDENAAQDSRSRQISYAQRLKLNKKNIHLTNVVLTQNLTLKKEELDDVTFLPCPFYRLRHIVPLTLFLRRYHRNNKILLLTTQDIHGVFWGAVIFAHLAKVPVIGQIHYDLSSPNARKELLVNLYGRFYEKIVIKLIMFFDGIRVVNSATKKFLETGGYKKPVCVSPVPVTIYSVNKNDPVGRWQLPEALHVLFVGRFVQVKNLDCWIDTAIKALLKNKNIEFAMIGDGDEKVRLEKYCDQHGLRDKVQFVGALSPEQLASWYADTDVLLLTSKHEGFGRVVVEAMNYNVVPVCANVAGPKDIIKHGINGFLDNAKPELLAKHLIALEENRDMLKAMGECARATVTEKYQPEILQKRWIDFLLSFSQKHLKMPDQVK